MNPLTSSLELWLHGRPGPTSRGSAGTSARFTPGQLEQIDRTVSNIPEAFMRATGGSASPRGAKSDMNYIGDYGRIPILTDQGQVFEGKDAAATIAGTWNMGAMQWQGRHPQTVRVVLSAPGGTPATAVLSAARAFAVQHLDNHPWALAIHQDTKYAHAHLVYRAESHDGKRINRNKQTLRDWRMSWAGLLREQGVKVNATLAAARAQQSRTAKADPAISHILQRQERSTVVAAQTAKALQELATSTPTPPDPAKATLVQIRSATMLQWAGVQRKLEAEGHNELAAKVGKFVHRFEPVKTEKDRIKEKVREQLIERIKETRAVEREPEREAPTR